MMKDLPPRLETTVMSVDATFKDSDGTDFVAIQVWSKKGANVYLRAQHLKTDGLYGNSGSRHR